MSLEIDELEQEQLDYLRRNAQEFNVPDDTIQYPDALKEPLSRPIVLNPEQERKIIAELKNTIPQGSVEPKQKRVFSIATYLDILGGSFMGIMEDLLNFDGNLENFKDILTKDDRTVLIATLVIIIAVFVIRVF